MDQRTLRWFDHIEKIDEGRMKKEIYRKDVHGIRRIRQRKRGRDGIGELSIRGASVSRNAGSWQGTGLIGEGLFGTRRKEYAGNLCIEVLAPLEYLRQ